MRFYSEMKSKTDRKETVTFTAVCSESTTQRIVMILNSRVIFEKQQHSSFPAILK